MKKAIRKGYKVFDVHIINNEQINKEDKPGSAINMKSTSGCCFSMGSGVIFGLARSNHVWL